MIASKLTKWDYYKRKFPEYLRNDGIVNQAKIFYDLLATCTSLEGNFLKIFDINDVLVDSYDDEICYVDYMTGISNYYDVSKFNQADTHSFEIDNSDSNSNYYKRLTNDECTHLTKYDDVTLLYNIDSDGDVSYFDETRKYWNDEMNSKILDYIGNWYGINRIVKLKRLANTPISGGTVYYEDENDTKYHYIRLNNYNFLKLIRFQIIKSYTDGSREDINKLYKQIDLPITLLNSSEENLTANSYFELKYLNDTSNTEYNVNYVDKQLYLNGYYDMELFGIAMNRYARYGEYVSYFVELGVSVNGVTDGENNFTAQNQYAGLWFEVKEDDNGDVNKNTVWDIDGQMENKPKNIGTSNITVEPNPNYDPEDKNADYTSYGWAIWN